MLIIVPNKATTAADGVPYRVCLPADDVEVDARSAKKQKKKTQRARPRAKPLIYKDGRVDCIRAKWGAPEGQGRVDGELGPKLGAGRNFELEKGKQRRLTFEEVVPWLLPASCWTRDGDRITITQDGKRELLALNFLRFGVN